MDFHKLLHKQINKHLTTDQIENPSFEAFLQSINDSYLDFERDQGIMDRTFKESENEYNEINDQLKKEIKLNRLAANNLYKSISKDVLDYDISYEYNDDLLFVSEYLKAQIDKTRDAEKALLENLKELEDYKYALDQTAFIALTDEKGIIKSVNDKFCEISQYSREELLGNTHRLISSKFHPKSFFKELHKTISSGNIWKGLIKNKKKNGDYYWVDTTIVPFLDADKKPFQYLAIRLDVTEIKNAEIDIRKAKERAEQSEDHNRLIMDSSLNSIVSADHKKKITFWNKQAEAVFGWKKEEVVGKPMIDLLIPSRYRTMCKGIIDQYQKNGENPYFDKPLELILLHKSGNEIYTEVSITQIFVDEATYFNGFIQDISKRKEAERKLYQSTKLLKTILANLRSGIRMEDQNRKLLFVNQHYCDMRNINSEPEELAGTDGSNAPNKAPLFFKDAERLIVKTEKTLIDRKLVLGELVETLDNNFIERDYIPLFVDNEFKGHLWKYTDVTEKVQTQKLLEQSEERNSLIMDSSLNAIVNVDGQGKIIFWNRQAELVFGWKEDEVLGKTFTEFMIPARSKELCVYAIYQYLNEGHNEFLNKQVELYLVNKAGDEFLAEITITPLTQDGETFFCAFLQDISKRKVAENQLHQTVELLKTLLSNFRSGILVEDENQKILFSNQLFWDYTNVKISPIEMEGIDYSKSFEEVQSLFKDSEGFVTRVRELMNLKQPFVNELMETTDNRFLERDYIPIYIDDEYKGHLWNFTDVTSRIQNQNLLIQSEMRSKLIMNASLNAIITIDIDGVITFWNQQAETIFGWNKDEVLGKDLSKIIIPHQYAEAHNRGMKHYSKTGEGPALNKPLELTAINRKGSEFPIEISIIPINENNQVFFCAFIQDISDKKAAENIRKIQEEKFQNVITHMNLGLIEVDNNDIIKYANQSFAYISGYEISELVGKNIIEFFAFQDNLDTLTSKNKLRQKGVSDIYQIPIKNKSGELRWLTISGAPNYDNKGNVIGSIGIHLDITDQKKLESDLEKEKTNALKSSKAKEVFLANMSHEIRTPLNAIVGFLRELDKLELTGLQKDYVNNSSIASKHLLAIINNILDISKIESGEMTLESVDFVFEKSISNVTTVLHPMLKQKGLDFNVTISKEIGKVLVGDALRLQQILYNLVGNAIKFTSKGSISINCEVVDDSTFSQKLKISISDTGIGMESSFVSTIFNKFSQEDKETTREYGGTGLGLSITKELVELMGGTIEIESEKNRGTTICLYLHYPKSSKENTGELDIVKPVTRLKNISILLVEDNYLNRMVAQNSLQYYNCEVTEAENGVEAVEILKNKTFDIILMDIQMPIMGGIEAVQIIRNELNLSTPIIALTANAFKTEIDKCRIVGMNDYVSKPFDEDILIETIAKYTVNKITSVAELGFPEKSSTEKLYNLTILQNLSRNNNEFVAKMIAIFVEQTTDVVKKITAAILLDDFMEVSRLIHKIKPSVESLGISSIITEIKRLEKIAIETTDKESISALFNVIKEVLEKAVIQLIADEIND